MTIQSLNPPRKDGFPKISEISLNRKRVKIDAKDPNFDKPISALTKEYYNQTGILIFKVK